MAEQVRLGTMTLDEAQASPFRNIITRSIGTAPTTEPDIWTRTLAVGDVLVLCSDGLSGHLEPWEIQAMALEHGPSVAALRLVEEANNRGGRDNITALVLSVRAIEAYPPDGAAPPGAAVPADAEAPARPEKRGWGRRKA